MRLFPGTRPANLGARKGKLAPPPSTPNAVSSQADPVRDPGHAIAPLSCDGDPAGAWKRLIRLVDGLQGTKIVTRSEGYLHAECESRLLGFVDDLECLLDAKAGVIHVRSAARLGVSDLGVNRARVETLRAQLGARS